jgi:hypothetical protein
LQLGIEGATMPRQKYNTLNIASHLHPLKDHSFSFVDEVVAQFQLNIRAGI